jgi:hypothetical protein
MDKQLLFSVHVYSDPDKETFAFDLGINEEYHKIVLANNCSINSIVVSLLFAFLMFYCEQSYLDFDIELEKALEDYLKEESVDLSWDEGDDYESETEET